jgi:hypothetical protein
MFQLTVVDCPRLIDAGDADIEAVTTQAVAPLESVGIAQATIATAPTIPAMTTRCQARVLFAIIWTSESMSSSSS